MYEVSEEFITAIESQSAIQHIRGSITGMNSVVVTLNDNNLTDKISTYSQCVSDSSKFGIGGMYVGYCECVLYGDIITLIDRMDGAKITLDFGIETGEDETEWIPLGVWNVDEAVRETGDKVRIKASDNLAKLKIPVEQSKLNYVGIVQISTMMSYITQLTGVEFAQTVEEIEDLFERSITSTIFANRYASTCWEMVQNIARILGGFAFANREGKIEFRRLDGASVLSVPASMRHRAQLERYTYTVGAVSYLDKYGYTTTCDIGEGVNLIFANCSAFMWDRTDRQEIQYGWKLDEIADILGNISFVPGEISYYGNPALDVGDHITLTDGVADDETDFIICCNSWQFRGPQVIISCGNSSANSSYSDYTSDGQIRASASAQTIRHIVGESIFDAVDIGEETELTSISFGCKEQTYVVLECDMVINYFEQGVPMSAQITVMIDGEVYEDYNPVFSSLDADVAFPVSISIPADLDGGQHTISVLGNGVNANVSRLHAFVWGQNITERSAEPTTDSDYIYIIDNGEATIIYYIGESTYPAVPDTLGGAATKYIEETAFNYRDDIEGVEIPDSVIEIR